MAQTQFYLLRFPGGQPHWDLYDGQTLVETGPPAGGTKIPVLALIPDKYFFYFMPRGVTAKREKNLRDAVRLQMQHFFPSPRESQEHGAVKVHDDVLGFFSHPGLETFWQEHEDLLRRATVVSSAFVLAWTAARAQGLPAWLWQDNGGPSTLFAKDGLYYFPAGEGELQERVQTLQLEEGPKELGWEEVLGILDSQGVKLGRLRLPLTKYGEAKDIHPRRWAALFVAIALVGLLFSFGQGWRWYTMHSAAAQWEQSLDKKYRQALGDDLGSDPYGRLLFRLEQLKGSQIRGVDMVELLDFMTVSAPQGFVIESMSLSNEQGTIRARVPNYDQLEKMLADMEGSDRYGFSLEQATNTESGILVSLRVTLR